MSVAEKLLTADQFVGLPEMGQPTELVRGRIITMNVPTARHGKICSNIVMTLGNFVAERDLGHVLSNDSGVITQRDPDTVRGADVAYYSYDLLPKGPLPASYPLVPPDVVFEVLSPGDRWPKILTKVAEYLDVGVSMVCLLDAERQTIYVYDADNPVQTLTADQQFTLPKLHEDFQVPVVQFFQ